MTLRQAVFRAANIHRIVATRALPNKHPPAGTCTQARSKRQAAASNRTLSRATASCPTHRRIRGLRGCNRGDHRPRAIRSFSSSMCLRRRWDSSPLSQALLPPLCRLLHANHFCVNSTKHITWFHFHVAYCNCLLSIGYRIHHGADTYMVNASRNISYVSKWCRPRRSPILPTFTCSYIGSSAIELLVLCRLSSFSSVGGLCCEVSAVCRVSAPGLL